MTPDQIVSFATKVDDLTSKAILIATLLVFLCWFVRSYRPEVQAREQRLRDDREQLHTEYEAKLTSLIERNISAITDNSAALNSLSEIIQFQHQEPVKHEHTRNR